MILRGMPAGLLDLLWVPARGLDAQQAGLGTVAHNVANANTPGFSRRDLELGPLSPMRGAEVLGHRRAVDRNLQRQIVDQAARESFAAAREPLLGDVEAVLGDLEHTGLGASFDDLFASFRTLAASPEDRAARQDTLARADALAAQMRRVAGQLGDLRLSADRRLKDEIAGVNDTLAEVARLNRDIRVAEATGSDAGDLRDRRDADVRSLGERVGAHALDDGTGGVIVLIGGMRVVQDDRAETLSAVPDPTTGLARVRLADPPASDVTADLGGTLGALVDVRDVEIPRRLAALDQLAWDITTSLNARHASGFGLDGVGGRNLFAPRAAVAGAAANMRLDAAVDGNPDALAAALDPTSLPGDGRNALEIADLEGQDLALSGTATFSEALGSLQAQAGEAARGATLAGEREADRSEQLDALRESISGVDTDEQLLMMSRYQRAYQASAKVVTALDDMLQTLLDMR
jgi:flagellar hook-associated protein 1